MKLRYPAAKRQPKADAPGFSAAGFIHHIERLCNAGQISGRYSPALIGDADFISGSLQTDGDLGKVGQTVLIDLLNKKGIDISGQHMDCGIEIFDAGEQDTHAGGSGCGCSAVTLSAYVLKMLEEGVWKRVLFAPTGALLSKTSFNEGENVPGFAHGVVLESPV